MIKRYIAAFLLLACSLCALPYTLVIDAGHGGKDPGAMGNKAKEKNINLAVALAFGKLVEQNCKDVKVVYTRKTDVFVELNERANIANKAKADLFISIHTNATAGKIGPQGTETYTLGMHRAADNLAVAKRENSVITLENNYEQKYEGFDPNSSESYIIFELMQDKNMESSVKLASLVQKQFRNTAKRVDKGVHQAGFLVLRATSMPSILIELGYINNPSEAAYLTSTVGVNAMAKSIYNAFVAYKK
ncbi:MAG: N-acetylmuramoyl-L-alanine amidase [Bacteroidaceae bacterium]|nr:N-acetylmuramoyl-L-alanine amidase [Bacteroidaceae bacterium]